MSTRTLDAMVAAEFAALADALESLGPDRWSADSLCAGGRSPTSSPT